MAATATREPSAVAEMCARITGGEVSLISGQQGRGAGSPEPTRRASWRKGGKDGGEEGVTGRWCRVSPGALFLGGSVAAALLVASASPRPRAVLRSWKPFLMSASRASMTHTSSCFPPPLLAEEPRDPQGHCPGSPEPLRGQGGGKATAQTGWSPAARSRPRLTGLPALAPRPAGLLLHQLLLPPLSLGRLLLPVLVLLRMGTARDPKPPAPQFRLPCSGTAGPQTHHTSHPPSGRGGRDLGRSSWC